MIQEELQTEKRDHFTFFRSFQEAIDQCQEKEQLALYKAIVNYALDGKEPSFENPLLKLAWTLIKPNLHNGWVRTRNGRKAEGVSKPGMKGNKNALKTKLNQSQDKAKTKLNQSNRIGMERIGKDNVSIETEEDKKEEADKPLSSPPVLLSERYTKFISWFVENCPHLKKMEQPAEDQFFKLLEKAGNANKLQDILLAMENNKETPSKRRSVYLTAMNWLNRDLKK